VARHRRSGASIFGLRQPADVAPSGLPLRVGNGPTAALRVVITVPDDDYIRCGGGDGCQALIAIARVTCVVCGQPWRRPFKNAANCSTEQQGLRVSAA